MYVEKNYTNVLQNVSDVATREATTKMINPLEALSEVSTDSLVLRELSEAVGGQMPTDEVPPPRKGKRGSASERRAARALTKQQRSSSPETFFIIQQRLDRLEAKMSKLINLFINDTSESERKVERESENFVRGIQKKSDSSAAKPKRQVVASPEGRHWVRNPSVKKREPKVEKLKNSGHQKPGKDWQIVGQLATKKRNPMPGKVSGIGIGKKGEKAWVAQEERADKPLVATTSKNRPSKKEEVKKSRSLTKEERSKILGNPNFLNDRRVSYSIVKLVDTPFVRVSELKRAIHENLGLPYQVFGSLEFIKEVGHWYFLVNSLSANEHNILAHTAVQAVSFNDLKAHGDTILTMWSKAKKRGPGSNVPLFFNLKNVAAAIIKNRQKAAAKEQGESLAELEDCSPADRHPKNNDEG
ncbi:hypothetical protein NUSPORA_02098a, partial [Nucleospora cyclopteri]